MTITEREIVEAARERQLEELHNRIIAANGHEEEDICLAATTAVLTLGWIHTTRRYGSGFIDRGGYMRTWRDLPSLDECDELVSAALRAARKVRG